MIKITDLLRSYWIVSLIAALGGVVPQAQASITCMSNHEDEAGIFLARSISKSLDTALSKKGIHLDSNRTTLELSNGQVEYEEDGDYGLFEVSTGTAVSTDGTEFLIDFSGNTPGLVQSRLYYKPVLTSKGFDKEGNAIDGHCTLILDGVRVNDKADFVEIVNSSTGHNVVKIAPPDAIELY